MPALMKGIRITPRRAWQPPQRLKQPIRHAFAYIGYELVRMRRPATSFMLRLISENDINLLVDVGANQGDVRDENARDRIPRRNSVVRAKQRSLRSLVSEGGGR